MANDLNNNILERESLLNGIYIPSPFISNNIFNRKDDIIFHDYDIKNLKQYFFSKYQSNYELSNYETTDEKVLLDNTSIQKLVDNITDNDSGETAERKFVIIR